MRSRRLLAGMLLALLCAPLAGCGGSSQLSAGAYRARLASLGREADKAYANLDKMRTAKSVAEIRSSLAAFATALDRLGDESASLKPPKDAEAANSEVARGEHDMASAIRSLVLPRLAKLKDVQAAVKLFQTAPEALTKASHELDHGLDRLRKLGYARGSS